MLYIIPIVSPNERNISHSSHSLKDISVKGKYWFTFLLPLLFHCSWNRNKNTVFSKLKLIAVSVKIMQTPLWAFVYISQTTHILCHEGINFFARWRNWSVSSQTPSSAIDESKFQLYTFSHVSLVMVLPDIDNCPSS